MKKIDLDNRLICKLHAALFNCTLLLVTAE